MSPTFRLPRPEHLSVEPQLATITLLETAAKVAIVALGAAYPELATLDADPYEPLELRAVADLIERARDLDAIIARYRRDLAERHESERAQADLLPF
jgi:hypothetical protein